jgi:hypothetical protein
MNHGGPELHHRESFTMRRTLMGISGLLALAISAGAQISGDQAVRTCRESIRRGAASRLGASNIEFRSTQLSENQGAPDRLEGTFAVHWGEKPEIHTYACSVDASDGSLEWAQIDSKSSETAQAGSTTERVYSDTDLIDKCRNAVRKKIYDHGYIGMHANSISIEKSTESGDRVVGTATAETGGNRNVFKFSCEISRSTGVIRSTDVFGQQK